ncbi:MAG: hypothetical protein Q8O56_16290, partial [Solirubrobacteraceae bacterium]|nr:hypothetical protein [Solirubrobacteraceae bacterium]
RPGTATLRGRTLTLPISCRRACAGTATVRVARTVRVGGRTALRQARSLGRASFRVRADRSASVRLRLAPSTAAALRRARVSTVRVDLRIGQSNVQTVRVSLRRR